MIKEARDRERFHRESAAVNAESSQAELEAERDAALSTARDLERQLMAVLADLEIARSDTERIMMDNLNLHCSDGVRTAIEHTGAKLIFLPTYSQSQF